ncbi:hypothetical protein D7X25_29970 [bacterium 1XD42-8]|nr:hypothetical protein D7X25_29970 [bacterium 1XD42-8]
MATLPKNGQIRPKAQKQENGRSQGSGVEKVAPRGIENTGFFHGRRKEQGILYLFPRKWG